MAHNIIDIPLDQYIKHNVGLPVAHANITATFFELDTRPTHSEIMFSQL